MPEAIHLEWLKAWVAFLTFSSDNLGYLSGDVDDSLKVHTLSVYFPLFRRDSGIFNLPRKKFIELETSIKNLHLVAIANLDENGLHRENATFEVKWIKFAKAGLRTTRIKFRFEGSHLIRVKDPVIDQLQFYFVAMKSPAYVLYMTFDLPVTEACIGVHNFQLVDSSRVVSISLNVTVKLKDSTVQLLKPKRICDGGASVCTALRFTGANFACQREVEGRTRGPVLQKRAPEWMISTIVSAAVVFVVVILAYQFKAMEARLQRKRNDVHRLMNAAESSNTE
ncbi:unnamed protein product [Calicophoron daubneyi]|uniref:Transmembrane protein n=1 Tax=Calicophoron daubneyi TaxID=300641 RepID=A0AAV2T6T5_CALDB